MSNNLPDTIHLTSETYYSGIKVLKVDNFYVLSWCLYVHKTHLISGNIISMDSVAEVLNYLYAYKLFAEDNKSN